ncbi:subclass B1 metallo-beta-lactamase [Lacihabitans sp. LS3-19]|uniref:subclass B1 metallo-beta-lactamase n=1 Tax=Lacihabitans sp. LS3-19 TaxID=2487335 RepID=UPI0020CD282D|nr:subclass B1 metallo-beta-lactamase [Lacihabitans sp. LS3-19]MCP9770073.1 subclass B1 metallo-beta-lactamase [Lacihabitans sp. LS3-19]
MKKLLFLIFIPFIFSCNPSKKLISNNEDLLVFYPIKKNIYTHISFLQTETWGKVACNGMVYIHKNKAYVFDTPADKEGSELLLKTLEENKIKLEGIVINHFHNDCLGGLAVFHKKGIKSYASNKTIDAAKKDSVEIPQIGFDGNLKIKIGKREIINEFVGEAHTKDNIVSYLPKEKVLFGGCMVKEVTAGKGYLGDANQKEWSNTIRNLKTTFPQIKHVIPGHGKVGGTELLDYTIELFEVK